MQEYHFKIYNIIICISGKPHSWEAFYVGNEGKKRKADFIIPENLEESDLCEYLADLFHEYATPTNHKTFRIS
ncbi:DUF7661 family protein [Leptospira harrisiae]|uniref:DUF7661 domain-containing protein n=1 Tax=Leptospira harrisiae TaxID=2023189 RepID=A0A2N0AMN6_9LEPT|nr:hypothetical protein CH364_04955 [Leptospira harrisiae]PKA09102.1 hypothetical protein CH366_05095 [Leptospira harrisiae]